jgi:hypothetical protein
MKSWMPLGRVVPLKNFQEKLTVAQMSNNLLPFMEYDGLLQCSQKQATVRMNASPSDSVGLVQSFGYLRMLLYTLNLESLNDVLQLELCAVHTDQNISRNDRFLLFIQFLYENVGTVNYIKYAITGRIKFLLLYHNDHLPVSCDPI